jgi:hypothetical protein
MEPIFHSIDDHRLIPLDLAVHSVDAEAKKRFIRPIADEYKLMAEISDAFPVVFDFSSMRLSLLNDDEDLLSLPRPFDRQFRKARLPQRVSRLNKSEEGVTTLKFSADQLVLLARCRGSSLLPRFGSVYTEFDVVHSNNRRFSLVISKLTCL